MRYLKSHYSDQLVINKACVSYGFPHLIEIRLRNVVFLFFCEYFNFASYGTPLGLSLYIFESQTVTLAGYTVLPSHLDLFRFDTNLSILKLFKGKLYFISDIS